MKLASTKQITILPPFLADILCKTVPSGFIQGLRCGIIQLSINRSQSFAKIGVLHIIGINTGIQNLCIRSSSAYNAVHASRQCGTGGIKLAFALVHCRNCRIDFSRQIFSRLCQAFIHVLFCFSIALIYGLCCSCIVSLDCRLRCIVISSYLPECFRQLIRNILELLAII